MTWETERPEPHPAALQDGEREAKEPMDFLVNALSRAVARKQATGSEYTENRP